MTSLRIRLLLGAAVIAMAGSAQAQTATAQTAPPAPAGKPAAKDAATVEGVEIKAAPGEVRTSIDSTSYSLANDLQAKTGTLADALRNIPSVDVDPQGNVSLRGDSNVTILVDGRPSGMLSGDGRAQAILSLPADQYARVEVMTNPSAAYSPEGSGGVINLITKPTAPKQGQSFTGSLRANIGQDERWNVGASANWQKDKLTLSGDLGLRHDVGEQSASRVRERLDPLTGAVISTTRQTQTVEGPSDVVYGRFTADYRLTDKLTVTGELRGNLIDNTGDSQEAYETADAAGLVTSRYSRDSDAGFSGDNLGATLRTVQRFDGAGHDWTNEVRYDRNKGHVFQAARTDYDVPALPDLYERIDNRFLLNVLGFTSAYVRPMPDDGKLKAGYELDYRDIGFNTGTSRGAAKNALIPDPLVTNEIDVNQAVHALYVTYERPFGKLSAQVGLRAEYADIQLNLVTTGAEADQSYSRLYPTLHLGYQISDAQQIKASYSRRIQRPQPFQLNPFVSYQDPLNLRSGNPDLEPQETDAFEVMWQLRAGQTFYQATAYLRDTDKAFTDVATDIGGGVLLTRPENLGSRRDYGVELVASGPITKTLKYNASVNLYQQEIDAAGLPGGEDRSGTVYSGRASLSWQPTPEDFLQLSGFYQGESLTAQGKREAGGMLNLGYRRKLTEKLAFQLTARDLLDDFGDTTTARTASFTDRNERTFGGRAVFIGLTWTFGAVPKRERDPTFDFSAPPTGG
ncbi:TonB-dependent receptor [Caulobacter sp. NIBR1757]|uniref:TonB-dependent receptor domain-containing protein n=1 Tax=Caulobacter sp. NIBR1757 TaxID=3016000 RepID=UPI0022F065A5|nr:TonB-dependent receptor [Caulobacter sp. NIBR1757]WGM37721.1 Vitamin B12 transporter BtuB [Caulobacter sp. NIBR1757]